MLKDTSRIDGSVSADAVTLATVDCRICGGRRAIIDRIEGREIMYGSFEPFTYLRCAECGTLQIEHIPDDLGKYYANETYYSFGGQGVAKPSLKERIRSVVGQALFLGTCGSRGGWLDRKFGRDIPQWASSAPRFRKDAAIIDVGCGSGDLLDKMRGWGFTNLQGADPFLSEATRTPGGAPLISAGIETLPTASYDVVMMHHAFEHVPDPASCMAHVRRVMKAGGYAVIAIPVSQGEMFEQHRRNWVHLDAPRHLHLFTVDGLTKLAERNGLDLIAQGFDTTAFAVLGSRLYEDDRQLYNADGSCNLSRFSGADWQEATELAARLNATGRGDTAHFIFRPV